MIILIAIIILLFVTFLSAIKFIIMSCIYAVIIYNVIKVASSAYLKWKDKDIKIDSDNVD